MRKKIIHIILAIALLIGSVGINEVWAQSAEDYGLEGPEKIKGWNPVTTWDSIYFGNYYINNETKKEPIRWRVLSVDGDDAFLMADKGLDCKWYYETVAGDKTWENSDIRKWLNHEFMNEAFTSEEQQQIMTTTVSNEEDKTLGTIGEQSTEDKVYLLSAREACTLRYGFSEDAEEQQDRARCMSNSKYAYLQGADTYATEGYIGNGEWLLRSKIQKENNTYACKVASYGVLDHQELNWNRTAIRPVLHLDLSRKDLWTKAGKVSTEDVGKLEEMPLVAPNPDQPVQSILSNPVRENGVATWDTIYMGQYTQYNESTRTPIQWRVLEVQGDEALLLSEQLIEKKAFDEDGKHIKWGSSCLRSWLNSDFLTNAFDEKQQSVIQIVTNKNNKNPIFNTPGEGTTEDKIFLLSLEEAFNSKYGFDTKYDGTSFTRMSLTTPYASGRPAGMPMLEQNASWYLRTPGMDLSYICSVSAEGDLICSQGVTSTEAKIRPAMRVNLSDYTMWYLGEKVSCSTGEVREPSPEPTLPPLPMDTARPQVEEDVKKTATPSEPPAGSNASIMSSGQQSESVVTPTKNPEQGAKEPSKVTAKSSLKKPVIQVKKKKQKKLKYLQIKLKKYQGSYANIYVSKNKKKYTLVVKKINIKKYKGMLNIAYKKQKQKLWIKVRVYKINHGKKVYSPYSKVVMVRT